MALTIQPVMCVNAVAAMMLRVMCAAAVARMTRWVMFVAATVLTIRQVMMQMTTMAVIAQVVADAVRMMRPVTTAAVIAPARQMTRHRNPGATTMLQRMIAVVDVDRVAAVDAAVTTPPVMTVVARVAAATIRAKFGSPAALDG